VFLEHSRVQSGQRTHDVGFGDDGQVGCAAIATSEHALYYGDSGAIEIENGATGTRTSRRVMGTGPTTPKLPRTLLFTPARSGCSRRALQVCRELAHGNLVYGGGRVNRHRKSRRRARRDIHEQAPAKFDDQGGGFIQSNPGGVRDSLGFVEPKPPDADCRQRFSVLTQEGFVTSVTYAKQPILLLCGWLHLGVVVSH
jgi:hypothetical protein